MANGSLKGQSFDTPKWKERLGCVGWPHMVSAIRDTSQGRESWIKGVSPFFAKQGITPFVGFEWLNDYALNATSGDEMAFFRREPWFVFLDAEVLNPDDGDAVLFIRDE